MRVQLSTALLLPLRLTYFKCSEATHDADAMMAQHRRVQAKASKTRKPMNEPTGSAAPTVSASPTTAKAAKKGSKSKKKSVGSSAPTKAPAPAVQPPILLCVPPCYAELSSIGCICPPLPCDETNVTGSDGTHVLFP